MTYDEKKRLDTEQALRAEDQKTLEERGRKNAKESIKFEKLDRLTKNEDFKWFLAEYWAPMLKEEHDAALNIRIQPQERNDHSQRHHAINEMLMVLQREITQCLTKLSAP